MRQRRCRWSQAITDLPRGSMISIDSPCVFWPAGHGKSDVFFDCKGKTVNRSKGKTMEMRLKSGRSRFFSIFKRQPFSFQHMLKWRDRPGRRIRLYSRNPGTLHRGGMSFSFVVLSKRSLRRTKCTGIYKRTSMDVSHHNSLPVFKSMGLDLSDLH